MILCGCILVLSTVRVEYGELTTLKCNFKIFGISLSISLILLPLLYQLIINFPEENKISTWFENHFILSFFLFFVGDIIIISITMISPFSVNERYIPDGKNFRVCNVIRPKFNLLIFISIIVYKSIIGTGILLLCFLEWNLTETIYDIRLIMGSIYIDMIGNIAYTLINKTNINNYKLYFFTREILYLFFCVNSFIFLYGYRIILALIKSDSENNEETLLKRSLMLFKTKTVTTDTKITDNDIKEPSQHEIVTINNRNNKSFLVNFINKMMNYHNQTTKNRLNNANSESITLSKTLTISNNNTTSVIKKSIEINNEQLPTE